MGLGKFTSKSSKLGKLAQLKKEGGYCKLNRSGATHLVGTTSKTSLKRPATFGTRHSPPYNILCASPWGLLPNVTFP